MWLALALTLLDWLGPLARKWLEDLLLNATAEQPAILFHPNVEMNIRDLFANARAQTWWWQARRRLVIDTCQRLALSHVESIHYNLDNGLRTLAPKAVLDAIKKVA